MPTAVPSRPRTILLAAPADLGVASGNGKSQIFVRGQVVATVPESRIVETLLDEAMRRFVPT